MTPPNKKKMYVHVAIICEQLTSEKLKTSEEKTKTTDDILPSLLGIFVGMMKRTYINPDARRSFFF